jgi:glycosyltransferase involved in cell wall biosynthesis
LKDAPALKVFVNAVSIREGGPLVVLSRLLDGMRTRSPDSAWLLALNPRLAAQWPKNDATRVLGIDIDRSPLHLLYWYERGLPAAMKRETADVLFSVTNYLPSRKTAFPSLLLEQHAGHFSPEFERLTLEASPGLVSRALWRRKQNWVRRSVSAASILTVQTAALADAIAAETGRPRDTIRVIAHGPGWVSPLIGPKKRSTGPFRIGYVTKWGVQKNFETVFRAVQILAQTGVDICLVLTLNETQANVRQTLDLALKMGIARLIENRGEVRPDALEALYDSLDAFAFASTCESFGMTMVEAMARGLPILVADTPGNREITENASLVFPPYDPEALAEGVRALINDPEEWQSRSEKSLTRARAFSWTKAAEETLAALHDAARGITRGTL